MKRRDDGDDADYFKSWLVIKISKLAGRVNNPRVCLLCKVPPPLALRTSCWGSLLSLLPLYILLKYEEINKDLDDNFKAYF